MKGKKSEGSVAGTGQIVMSAGEKTIGTHVKKKNNGQAPIAFYHAIRYSAEQEKTDKPNILLLTDGTFIAESGVTLAATSARALAASGFRLDCESDRRGVRVFTTSTANLLASRWFPDLPLSRVLRRGTVYHV